MRFFNIEGPVNCADHYCLPPLSRLDMADVMMLIAKAIHREVIPRGLTYSAQLTIAQQPSWYIRADDRLDLPKLLTAFQQFFREHSESWVERFDYKEAGPQLLMQAFLLWTRAKQHNGLAITVWGCERA